MFITQREDYPNFNLILWVLGLHVILLAVFPKWIQHHGYTCNKNVHNREGQYLKKQELHRYLHISKGTVHKEQVEKEE